VLNREIFGRRRTVACQAKVDIQILKWPLRRLAGQQEMGAREI
jgi:hypothetical protein